MKKIRRVAIPSIIMLAALGTIIHSEEIYKIDPTHAEIGFAVTHLVISKVKGHFHEFEGTLVVDDKSKVVNADAMIKASSIDTGIKKRDDHLRSPDFFDAEKYSEITYKNVTAEKRGGRDVLVGEFTIRDVTKQLVLPYTIKGPVVDPWGNKKIGFEAKAVINRKDYGVAWNMKTETGGWVVGEEVELLIDFEATKQKKDE